MCDASSDRLGCSREESLIKVTMVGSHFASAALATRPSAKPASADVTVDLTTEMRWFFDDRMPDEVLAWFTDGGVGLLEDRCDRYRLDGETDIGVKERSGTTLELKLLRGEPEVIRIGSDFDGQIETWQRWSPVDRRVCLTGHTVWIEVAKRVIKRRFSSEGREVFLSEENRAMTGTGCDVEIARLEVDGRPSWTFALAAFGPIESHRRSLRNVWGALDLDQVHPLGLRLDSQNSCGYPRWMTKFMPASPAQH